MPTHFLPLLRHTLNFVFLTGGLRPPDPTGRGFSWGLRGPSWGLRGAPFRRVGRPPRGVWGAQPPVLRWESEGGGSPTQLNTQARQATQGSEAKPGLDPSPARALYNKSELLSFAKQPICCAYRKGDRFPSILSRGKR